MIKEEIKVRKLVAEEGKIIVSKKTHYDTELKKEVPDIQGEIVFLGKGDSEENYEEIKKTEEDSL